MVLQLIGGCLFGGSLSLSLWKFGTCRAPTTQRVVRWERERAKKRRWSSRWSKRERAFWWWSSKRQVLISKADRAASNRMCISIFNLSPSLQDALLCADVSACVFRLGDVPERERESRESCYNFVASYPMLNESQCVILILKPLLLLSQPSRIFSASG